jgi:hypothetical protein
MIKTLRSAYNANFSQEKYNTFLGNIKEELGYDVNFRVSESPVFVDKAFKDKLLQGCEDVFRTILSPDFKEKTEGSLSYQVPNENGHSHFMQVDFGVCMNEKGEIEPQLIEIQGFPSLYTFQAALAVAYRKAFSIPATFSTFLNGYTTTSYLELLREVIVGNCAPENVVLLEIEPEKQGTAIDFWACEKYLGVKMLCLTKLKKEGKNLFYFNEKNEKIAVKRIYNRVIFDELERRTDLEMEFNFTDDVNVEWVGHPNWFFRISKYTLPLFDSPYAPKSYFLSDLKEIPSDLENYVLKPLFSFAGMGVKINVTPADIEAIEDKENYILQKKVNYYPIIETPSGPAKIEIRMMVVWRDGDEKPIVVNNICRMSKGEMVGVRYNKDKDWVGGTVCFFEQ